MNPRRLTRRVGNGFEQVDVLGPTRGCCQTWRPRRPGRGRGSQRSEPPAADAVMRAIRRRGRCAKLGPGVVLVGERAATRCASLAGTVIRSAGVSYVRHTARRNVPNKRSCPAGAEHPSSSPRVAADYWTPACPIADRRSPGDPEHISSSAQSCGQVLDTHNDGSRAPGGTSMGPAAIARLAELSSTR